MRAERPAAIAGGALAAGLGLGVLAAFRRVLSTRERPCWPPPPDRGDAGERAGRDRGLRRGRPRAPARRGAPLRVVHGGHGGAVGRGRAVLPADPGRRRGGPILGAHPHVRLARGGDRDGARGAARGQGGRRRRGARADRRLRLEALRPGAGDVHRARRGGRADRRQRRPPARPARPLPARAPHRSPPARARQRRPPQAVRDRRAGRVDRAARASRTTSATGGSTT